MLIHWRLVQKFLRIAQGNVQVEWVYIYFDQDASWIHVNGKITGRESANVCVCVLGGGAAQFVGRECGVGTAYRPDAPNFPPPPAMRFRLVYSNWSALDFREQTCRALSAVDLRCLVYFLHLSFLSLSRVFTLMHWGVVLHLFRHQLWRCVPHSISHSVQS